MKISGTLRVPGDKSISHRSLILGALADEGSETRVTRILQSADVHSTAGILRDLGADIPELSDDFVVKGVGRRGLRGPIGNLDAGNSGTTTRLMAGVVAALPFEATFVGDASLSRRPMRRVAKPLEAMGARFELPTHGGLPMTIHGGTLHDIEWTSEVASAQVKSAILLAALTSGVRARVFEHERTRDHTERMLRARGATVTANKGDITIDADSPLTALDSAVPGDPSSAAFFAGLAAIANGGELTLEGVCMNETRTGFFRRLQDMGVNFREEKQRDEGGESVSDLVISPNVLRAVTITREDVPSMVDELPLLACLAARAEGETRITGANELRVKESDRITAVVDNLRTIGVSAEELADGMVIVGSDRPLRGRIITHADHRLAMAFGILGAAEGNEIEIDDPACVEVSYPGFWDDLARATGKN
ncbi:MAG TPA: 3-phosphoshikimate 1-carboxyvinyltransferase [Gemmatimonadaceae bacterium]|jgi:3-phosphoshikimate 1-carboxyvinyltransferase